MAGSGILTWSQTASANASSDSSINWAEGQSPSSVNNSARAMMASTAKWRDDISGALTTDGTSTAYAVALNQAPDALSALNGQMVAFVPHVTNDATVTLNVSGFGAKPLRGATGKDLLAGVLVAGTPYVASYFSGTQEWLLHGSYANPYSIPLGAYLPYGGASAPNVAFALPFGQALSRTTYAPLFSLFGTRYGAGDGSTTFNIPDVRGRVFAFLDNMGGTAAGRLTAAGAGILTDTLGSSGGFETISLTANQNGQHTHANSLSGGDHSHGFVNTNYVNNFVTPTATVVVSNFGSVGFINSTATANANVSLTNASSGTGAPHLNVQPTFMANCILRIL